MKQSLEEMRNLLEEPSKNIEEFSEIVRDLKVGDKIRSYDFEGKKNYYMEGTIKDMSDGFYNCEGDCIAYRDGLTKVIEDFRTPITSWCFDYKGRIEKI